MNKLAIPRPDPKQCTACILGVLLCGVLAFWLNRIYVRYVGYSPYRIIALFRVSIFSGILFFLYLHFLISPEKIYGYLFQHRFALAAILFAVCVALKLHGSSIGMWNEHVACAPHGSPFQFPILGIPRSIRSDEWIVFTPLAMSQHYTGYAVVNDIACAWPTNMLTTYNQPVWDLTVIAKPFYWGYLLLGSEYGLSWFWCGRLIALFLVTFEMFLLITGQKKKYALAAACLITFSAFVQWWFAINFLVEMLVWGQLAELMLYRFLNTDSVKTKLLCTGVFTLCAMGYLFAMYPAWMVPLFYVFAGIALWILLDNFFHTKRSVKELLYPVASLVAVGIVALHWVLVSGDAISTTMNTVYPGQRHYTGGAGWDHLFFYVNNLFLPYHDVLNSCESAMVYGFFPFTEILVAIYLVKTKFRDKLLTILWILDLLYLALFLFGAPAFLTRITLLYLTTNRISPIICTVEVILFLRLLSVEDGPLVKNRKTRFALLGAFCVMAGLFVWGAKYRIPPELNPAEGLQPHQYVIMVLLLVAFCAYFLIPRTERRKTAFAVAAVMLSLVTGLFVNPLMRTTDSIYAKPLAQAVQSIQAQDPGTWITTDRVQANFLICIGAPTVNSVNIIPTLERWELLDPEGTYEEVYNRYAHFYTVIAEETRFEMGSNDDWFTLYISPEDLRTLGVKYVCRHPWAERAPEAFYEAAQLIYTDELIEVYRMDGSMPMEE